MKSGIAKITYLTVMMTVALPAWSQANGNGSSYLLYGIMAVAAVLFLGLVLQVSDNLLAIEAKRIGADRTGANFSIWPTVGELFTPRRPEFVEENDRLTYLRRGHNIKLEGEPAGQAITDAQVRTFALQPPNFTGVMPIPKMLVGVGDQVKAGDPVFFDKKTPNVKYVAPVSGEIVAINRAAKRAISEVVILADADMKYRQYDAFDLDNSSREELVAFLLESGAWPMIRQRPYNVVAEENETPRDIFISTFDTAPLAPDLNLVVAGREQDFQRGLDALSKLTDGKVYLGLDAKSENPPSKAFTEARGVERHWFHGKHPAGNVGVQIHNIAPMAAQDKVWTLGVQEVITIGALFTQQRFDAGRVLALTGAELKTPKYVRTYVGASIEELTKGNLANDHVRFISGDVLSGERKTQKQFLNFFDDQLTVVEEGDDYQLFGWLLPTLSTPSVSRAIPTGFLSGLRFKAETNTHGEKRAFVVTGQYEALLPMDVYLQHLMKAILIKDFERMEGLGIFELVEEDIALCEFACTSKQPLQAILREGLDLMREQG